MSRKPLHTCLRIGCSVLIRVGTYCPLHFKDAKQTTRDAFDALTKKKTTEEKKFYGGSRWTACSKQYRVLQPLCEECYKKGMRVASQMVHHEPSRQILIARDISPYNSDYLVALCNRCHLAELRKKINHNKQRV